MTLVSDNIRYLRKLNGLTQEQFSRKISIKRSLLGAYEEGRANPNQQNIQAIAKAFNTTVELLTRQDLRKIRETPSLSIPLGQKSAEAYISRSDRGSHDTGSTIRSDGKLLSDDDPFQHPDFPDIFAQPSAPTPEPQPLSSVLSKYYKSGDEPRRGTPAPDRDNTAPMPPVITSPVRPETGTPVNERPSFQAPYSDNRPVERSNQNAVDHLFAFKTDTQPSQPRPDAVRPSDSPSSGRSSELLTFNNTYEGATASAHVTPAAQALTLTIPVVMQRQFAEYGQRHQQADFLHRLPAMHVPTLPEGQYRAFEADDEFAFPGALLVGKFIRNWFDIADGKLYILLIQSQPTGAGVCCRRVYNQVKIKGTLLLTADRADIPNREVALKDVLEVWEVSAFFSQQLPSAAPNTERLRQLVNEIRFEVERL